MLYCSVSPALDSRWGTMFMTAKVLPRCALDPSMQERKGGSRCYCAISSYPPYCQKASTPNHCMHQGWTLVSGFTLQVVSGEKGQRNSVSEGKSQESVCQGYQKFY